MNEFDDNLISIIKNCAEREKLYSDKSFMEMAFKLNGRMDTSLPEYNLVHCFIEDFWDYFSSSCDRPVNS
jgi:hypothetical protein